ncbi:serine/threonine protein kinase [Saprolegnia parasitica CBS 223.65]|uniref:Serine/threonine protein kinase n=1 Tax=Saprolegnia parasitica (strain CBS 223.65) TaxID=695850 RepID=A0A067BVU1_SAPPC|nr:serine/threonine protein kinase [Saprolegnia parasitica CBS 223.65]KDO22634.1 serine/threonine protein kinase [Saprolegnia parasitica CBS 223.65]|eukprot:XP_012206670.1 serine/threonine protein kinase [Saprolegnia parasitica CBS 223.65]
MSAHNELLAAIEANAIPAVVQLTKTKSSVNHAGSTGMTPLCLAAHMSREAIVAMLLMANANPNQSNGCGQTPLSIAATTGDAAIVEMLLQDGADVNATDKDLNSPLLLAVQHGHEQVMHRLFAANADATKRNTNGDTALTVAMTCCRRDAVRRIYAVVAQPPTPILPDEVIGKIKLSSGGHKCLIEHGHYRGEGVAIKSMLHPRDTPAITAEITALDVCKSPYLLQLRGITGTEEHPLMITEYMSLGNLRDFLDKKREAQAVPRDFTAQQVLWVVANALADLHAHCFLHRDLTSHNVLLCNTNYIKVANLGDANASLMDRPMSMLSWCAPEVLSGASGATAAADVYSLGVIMTELDTFQLPYWDVNLDMWALTDNIRNGRVRPAVSATCAPWYKALAESCMAFDATTRPTAETIVATLELHTSRSTGAWAAN